jgi:hypothetical protein
MNNHRSPSLFGLIVKTSIVHTITYFIMGALAYNFLGYAREFAQPYMVGWMRQTSDPLVMIGPLFQPLRGLIFALAIYPLRGTFFEKKNGWLVLGWVLVALGILSTFGPTPGSVEGLLYTIIPVPDQLAGWLEVVPQALLLSAVLYYWVRHPDQKWLNWSLGIIFVIVMSLPIFGLLAGNPH